MYPQLTTGALQSISHREAAPDANGDEYGRGRELDQAGGSERRPHGVAIAI
jgi:hypothetical protein